ncbi:MAG: hypothetical protein IPF47_00430 [Gemmatimonadetes bacterium]|nr:hypothetical protein [Gemmatimonadota bacterium]
MSVVAVVRTRDSEEKLFARSLQANQRAGLTPSLSSASTIVAHITRPGAGTSSGRSTTAS